MVFIATPHRGSRVDRGGLGHLGSRLVRLPDPLRASHGRLMARNGPDFFTERFRKGLPTSIDELEWESPILTGLDELGLAPTIKAHSIIAAGATRPPPAGATAWSRTRVPISKGSRPSRSSRPATCARTTPPSSARSGESSRSTRRRESLGIPDLRLCRTFLSVKHAVILKAARTPAPDLQHLTVVEYFMRVVALYGNKSNIHKWLTLQAHGGFASRRILPQVPLNGPIAADEACGGNVASLLMWPPAG